MVGEGVSYSNCAILHFCRKTLIKSEATDWFRTLLLCCRFGRLGLRHGQMIENSMYQKLGRKILLNQTVNMNYDTIIKACGWTIVTIQCHIENEQDHEITLL